MVCILLRGVSIWQDVIREDWIIWANYHQAAKLLSCCSKATNCHWKLDTFQEGILPTGTFKNAERMVQAVLISFLSEMANDIRSLFSFLGPFSIPCKWILKEMCFFMALFKSDQKVRRTKNKNKRLYYMEVNNSRLTALPNYPSTMHTTSPRIGSDTGLWCIKIKHNYSNEFI